MAANLNRVFLMGNLTRDPKQLSYTAGTNAVTELAIAVNRYYTTKEGEKREEVTFVDVTVWGRLAENCCQYLKKGRPVHVEGHLKLDSWDDKTTGEKRYKLKVQAESVQFLGGRDDVPGGGSYTQDDEAPAPRSSSGPPANGASGPPRSNSNAGPSSTPRRPAPAPDPEADDDIPF